MVLLRTVSIGARPVCTPIPTQMEVLAAHRVELHRLCRVVVLGQREVLYLDEADVIAPTYFMVDEAVLDEVGVIADIARQRVHSISNQQQQGVNHVSSRLEDNCIANKPAIHYRR